MAEWHRINRFKLLVCLALLLMTLARMVWVQLRDFSVSTDYRSIISFSTVTSLWPDQCAAKPTSTAKDATLSGLLDQGMRTQPGFTWFSSSGLVGYGWLACENGIFDPLVILQLNYLLLGCSVFAATLLVRFLTGSWLLSLSVAAMLMSRGSYLARLGQLSDSILIGTIVMVWFTLAAHFLRSGSPIIFSGLMFWLPVAVVFENSLLSLGIAIPGCLLVGWLARRLLALPLLHGLRLERSRLRQQAQEIGANLSLPLGKRTLFLLRNMLGFASPLDPHQPNRAPQLYQRGNVTMAMPVAFVLWVYHRRRWLKLFGLSLLVVGMTAAIYGWQLREFFYHHPNLQLSSNDWREFWSGPRADWFKSWLVSLGHGFDLHLITSLALLALALPQSPADGIPGFFEMAWLFFLSFVGCLILVLGSDVLDALILQRIEGGLGPWSVYAWARVTQSLAWFEPVILAMGVAAAYNLVKVSDSWLVRSRR